MNIADTDVVPDLALNAGILEVYTEQRVNLVTGNINEAVRRAGLAVLHGGVIQVSDIGSLISYLASVLYDARNYR